MKTCLAGGFSLLLSLSPASIRRWTSFWQSLPLTWGWLEWPRNLQRDTSGHCFLGCRLCLPTQTLWLCKENQFWSMDPTLILFYLWRPRISQMKWKKVKMLVAQSYPAFCNPMDCSPQGSNIHGIFQARILEWVAISFSRYLPDPGIKPMSLVSHALAGGFFTTEPPGNPQEYWSGQPLPSSGIFLTQGSNPSLPHCRRILYCLSHQGSLISHIQVSVKYLCSQGAVPPNWTVSGERCIEELHKIRSPNQNKVSKPTLEEFQGAS